jgi:hypothetical protein
MSCDQFWRSLTDGPAVDFSALAIQTALSAVYTGLIVAVAAYVWQWASPTATESAAAVPRSVSNKWRMLTE